MVPEAARAVGVLGHAGLQAHLSEERGLLVARDARNGHFAEAEGGGRDADDAARRFHGGEHRHGHAEECQQFLVPRQRVDVEQHRPRRVAHVGDVFAPARELPHEPRVDGAKRQSSDGGTFACAGHVVEQPADLAGREVRIDQQAGLLLHQWARSVRLQALAERRRPSVLPDDGVVNGFAGVAVPHHGGLALIRDADGGDVRGAEPRASEGFDRHADLRRPDLARVVFHPAGLREDLRELLLGHRTHGAVGVEDDGA